MSTGESEPGSSSESDEPLVSPAERSVSGSEPAGAVSESDAPSSAPLASPGVGERAAVESYEPPRSGRGSHGSTNMLPQDRRRSPVERLLVRLIATCGIVGIGVAIAAIMVSSKSQGWVVGLVVSIVSVILAALLWSSRML